MQSNKSSEAAKRPRDREGSSLELDRCVEPGSMCGVVRGVCLLPAVHQGHRKTYKASWTLLMGRFRRGRRLLWRTESDVKDGICGIPALLGLAGSRVVEADV